MNWFKRHLNWTLFLVVCALQAVGYPVLTFFARGEGIWDFWIVLAIGFVIYYGVYGYVLSEKGWKRHNDTMHFGWLLLLLTGWIGVIILLFVKHHDTIFFSHSLTTYDTPIEQKCLKEIARLYPDCRVINPKDVSMLVPIIATDPTDKFNKEMERYFLPLVRGSNLLLYYKDESFSPGVDMEIAEANKQNIPIINLRNDL